jgi:P27 family predicted phage terminase small subunit
MGERLKIVGGTGALAAVPAEVVKHAALGGVGLDWSTVPEDLAGAGRETWLGLAATFREDPVRFREADRRAVATYCRCVEMEAKAAAALVEHGVVVEGRSESDKRSRPVRSPAWAMWRDAQASVRQWGNELGLSPSSRSRMKVPEPSVPGESNPFGAPSG